MKTLAKRINEKNIKEFVDKLNAIVHKKYTITLNGHPVFQHQPYLFKIRKEDSGEIVVYDYHELLDLFSEETITKIIISLAAKYKWYPIAYTCGCDFVFGRI